MNDKKDFFCNVCGRKLVLKKELLWCAHCSIFIGNPKTFKNFTKKNIKEQLDDSYGRLLTEKSPLSYFWYSFFIFLATVVILIIFGFLLGFFAAESMFNF